MENTREIQYTEMAYARVSSKSQNLERQETAIFEAIPELKARYFFEDKYTGKEFNILTKTLFQNTKIDLPTWFEIIFREHSDKGGLAATTIMRDYGLSYTTAWHMLHKIRNAMGFENHKELSGTVEVD